MRRTLLFALLCLPAALASAQMVIELRGETGAPGPTGPRGTDGTNGLSGAVTVINCLAPEFLQAIAPDGTPTCTRPSGAVPVTTRKLVLLPYDFEARDTGSAAATARVAWSRDGARMRRAVAGQASHMEAALHLPDGALVTQVACSAKSNVSEDLTVKLWSRTSGGKTQCSTSTKTGSAHDVMTLPGSCAAAVSNFMAGPSFNQLSLTVQASADNATAGWGVYACEVSFSVTTLLP